MTSTNPQNDQKHPTTVVAYRKFKNSELISQEWTFDYCDEDGEPIYTTDPVSPYESIPPIEYLKDLHLTPQSVIDAAIKRQEEAVRAAQHRLDSEQSLLASLKAEANTLTVVEYKS